jgi:hypothetical protein
MPASAVSLVGFLYLSYDMHGRSVSHSYGIACTSQALDS